MKGKSRVVRVIPLIVSVFFAGPAVSQRSERAADLVEHFKTGRVFWSQVEVAKELVRLHDPRVLPALEPYLKDEDRHVRGDAALIFAGLGDDRGFEVIRAILEDRSARPEGQGGRVCSSGSALPCLPFHADDLTQRVYYDGGAKGKACAVSSCYQICA
jgi:hypothetical protein